MKFTKARNDLRVLQVDAYGPFTQDSEFALQDRLRAAHNPDHFDLRVEPVVLRPGFTPRFLISTENRALLVLRQEIDPDTHQSLKLASVGNCSVGNLAQFEVYDLTVVERAFLSKIDFACSEFQLVGLTIDRSRPPRVLQIIDNVNTYEDIRALGRANPIRKVLPTKITLKEPWEALFFQFFNYTYVASHISLGDSGLVPEPLTCELVLDI